MFSIFDSEEEPELEIELEPEVEFELEVELELPQPDNTRHDINTINPKINRKECLLFIFDLPFSKILTFLSSCFSTD